MNADAYTFPTQQWTYNQIHVQSPYILFYKGKSSSVSLQKQGIIGHIKGVNSI